MWKGLRRKPKVNGNSWTGRWTKWRYPSHDDEKNRKKVVFRVFELHIRNSHFEFNFCVLFWTDVLQSFQTRTRDQHCVTRTWISRYYMPSFAIQGPYLYHIILFTTYNFRQFQNNSTMYMRTKTYFSNTYNNTMQNKSNSDRSEPLNAATAGW